MRVELICVGTELLTGKTSAHGATFGAFLEERGFPLARETNVSDDPFEMEAVFREAWRRARVVITTGGLGPTFDDVTREVWSKVTGRRLRRDAAVEATIAARFRARGLRMPPANRRQAQILSGASVLPNALGTAPGQCLWTGKKMLALFPGPPRELKSMVDNHWALHLERRFPSERRTTRVWRFFGLAESVVDETLRSLPRRSGEVWGILAQQYLVDVKLTLAGANPAREERRFAEVEQILRRAFGSALFGSGRDTLEEVVGRRLRARRETLAVAESCTGGGLGARLTTVAGGSDYFWGGWIVYDNRAKVRLGVPPALLERFGAVSRPVARALAEAARRKAGTDHALSITGVAGPAGGTPRRPVGRVYIALASEGKTRVWEKNFLGERAAIREQSALWALNALREMLGKN